MESIPVDAWDEEMRGGNWKEGTTRASKKYIGVINIL